MKLISMTNYVLLKSKSLHEYESTLCEVLKNYAIFLNREITLSDLIPCDEKGLPFSEKIESAKKEEAKKKLFFKINIDYDTAKFHIKQKRKIEHFTFFDIEITDYAIKKFQLQF